MSFPVRPTPDDGARLSPSLPWDESTRPTAPPRPDRRYSPHEVANGQHLVDVHDHLRGELTQVRQVVEQVLSGDTDPSTARSHINATAMRQNNWTLGAFCQGYCRLVTTHHTLEDVGMLPHLRRSDPELAPVVDRLEAEHAVIAEVLEQLDSALVGFIVAPDDASGLRAAVDLLTDVLLSHLSYEERELVEPLARHGLS